MKSKTIALRGGLGNQVIQALIGTSFMLERGSKDYKYIFYSRVAREHKMFHGQIDKLYLNDIFKLKHEILTDQNNINKTRYWEFGCAQLYAKWYRYILSDLNLVSFNSSKYESVVHVRNIGDGKIINAESYFEDLIHMALARHREVAIVGDNQSFISSLVKKFSNFDVANPQSVDAINDWRIIRNAQHVYCSPSTFAISTKLLDPNKNLYILNPCNYSSYKNAINEYSFIYELKKAFGGIEILPPLLRKENAYSIDTISFVTPLVFKLEENSYNFNNRSAKKPSIMQEISSSLSAKVFINSECKEANSDIQSIKNYLQAKLSELRLSQSIFSGLEGNVLNYFLSSNKSKPFNFPPIVEEAGLSMLRHYLFNYIYLSKATDRLNKLKANTFSYNYLKQFIENGFLVLENCLPPKSSAVLAKHFLTTTGSLSKNEKTLLSKSHDARIEDFSCFFEKNFIDLLSLLTGYNPLTIKNELLNNTFFQTVKLIKDFHLKDQQQLFHLDTFYPAFKYWYFPFEVTSMDAPFEYAVKSHLPTTSHVSYFHRRYLDNSYDTNYAISPDNKEGSLRITEVDLNKLNLSAKKILVPANSLVIANVGGFHRRSIHHKNVIRHAIHSSIRPKNIFENIYV